ncbi:MAG: ribosome small subunit-dependent GTPase A [Clostridiales bacterium]|nr:ribosome small subunit-dependent GTPase A [Clostridiales bacterium]
MNNELTRRGLIIKGIGGLYTVRTADGDIVCKARGKFRISDIKPMVGDNVAIKIQPDDSGVTWEIETRKNDLVRPALANLDRLIVIASEAPPITDKFLIDKVTAIAGHKGIEIIVCINKCDLAPGEELERIYKSAGFMVIKTSAKTGQGIDEIKSIVTQGITALTGNSGVGKSSIIRHLKPNKDIPVGALSEKIGRGKQTTKHVELFELTEGRYIADTPGFQSFDVERMDLVLKDDLQHAFIDFAPFIPDCRFTSCTHIKEKGCAVRKAVKKGEIEESRYGSYIMLYESMKEINEWELKKQERND